VNFADPAGCLRRLPLRLELGCASSKRDDGAVGVDLLDLPGVDVVGDALAVLRSLSPSTVDSIYSEHFLEHVPDPEAVVVESARVLRPGGTFTAVVPHFSNPYFYSDPTHRAPFGLYTFCYWVAESPFRRQVPHYREPLPLAYERVEHVFKSGRPFYGRHAVKKALSWWVNRSRWTQELYEENLCWLLPCYEIRHVLRRR
jgi:ubiquinone/menaquinone biosynthesis C-methylase UbiE